MGRDLQADSDANLWATWRHIGERSPGARIDEDDYVLAIETGARIPTFNPVFVRRVPDDVEHLVRRAIDRDVPVVVTANPALRGIERLVDAALATGLVESTPLPGMVLDDLAALDRSAVGARGPSALTVRRVGAPSEWDDYFDVLCAGFGVEPRDVAPLLVPEMYDTAWTAAFLGFDGSEPVATSLAFVAGTTGGVYNVATRPGHRRRGYGEAMTWAAAMWGLDHGAEVSVLQASQMGRPIYERMGYRCVVPYVQLVTPA